MINTKVFIKRLLAIASSLILFSCSNEEELENNTEFINKVVVECEDVEFEPEVQTRTSYASNLAFSWSQGDTLGIYPIGADQVAFPISSGEGSKSASFDGGAWALRSTYQYAGYFPFSANNYHNPQTAIPFSYEGQSQNGSGTMTNLGKYDFMAAAATTPTATGNVSLQMKRLGCFMRLSLTVPEPCTLTKVTVESNGVKFGTKGTINLTSSAPSLNVTKTSATMQTTLSNVTTRTSNENVIVWIQTAPVNLSSETLFVSATASNGYVYSGAVAGKKMDANGGYGYSVTLTKSGTGADGEDPNVDFNTDTTPYVTFHAEATQALTMSKAVETLEYSVNNGDWTELGTNTVIFGGGNGDLRLRGKSRIGTSSSMSDMSVISFDNDTKVSCFGDIRTIVDYQNYLDADCSEARFICLFNECRQLVSAPKLPAMRIAENCYRNMFYRCTSLKQAPELPAMTLSDLCYAYMFSGCESLSSVPDLPATTLAARCYLNMFSSCTSIKKMPELPARELKVSCYEYMFADCASLVEIEELPAEIMAKTCYQRMFSGCESLVKGPDLLAMSLAEACYRYMFTGCVSLTDPPKLPATTLADNCYANMFRSCTSLQKAPELPASVLTYGCYYEMFWNCSSLNYIKMLATNVNAFSCLYNWTYGISSTGVFCKSSTATWSLHDNGIPDGWGSYSI